MTWNKRNGFVAVVLALVVVAVLALPLAAGAAQANGITSPADGATVSGKVAVTGYADDPSFSKWQLDLLPGGDANAAIFLALGTKPGEVAYMLDTTAWPNGDNAFRLRVVRADSNYSEYISKFTIANGAAVAPVATAAAAPAVVESVAAAPAAATPAPAILNGLTSPKAGATVSGEVDITGFASDPSFLKWQLDLLPGGDANKAIFLALGNKPGEAAYVLDTANLPSGEHVLRLRVVRADSNYDEYTSNFTIAAR